MSDVLVDATPNKCTRTCSESRVNDDSHCQILHPNTIILDTKTNKLHTLLNQIWESADTNMMIFDGKAEDYSQNLQFADRLDHLAACVHGLGNQCLEKAQEIRDKIKSYSEKQKQNVHTEEEREIPEKTTDTVSGQQEYRGEGSMLNKSSTETFNSIIGADTKFCNVKSNNNNPNKYRFQCEVCSTTFHNKFELRNHEGQHIREFYKCLVCSKVFRSSRSFDNHQKSHRTLHKCDQCGACFNLKTSLSNHMQKHSGQKYTCDVPNYSATFTYRQGFIEHIKWRHRDKPECECPICQKVFWTPTLMRGHKFRSHSKVKNLVQGYN